MIGRERELAALRGMLDTARAGDTTTVLLRGEAGIGKSTLLAALEQAAAEAGFRALVCAGVQSEASIGMAGLHQLLHGAGDRIDGLPPQQRDALRSAFGIGPDVAPDRLLLSVAVLSLLEDLAGDRPLLLVLEDVQWMDEPTLGMIAFVVRRLREIPILVVASCRDEAPAPLGTLRLPEMVLPRLPGEAADRLLAETNPGLDPQTRALVLDEAEGNPLALIELARGLAGHDPIQVVAAHPRLPLPERLERVFAAQIAGQPAATRDLLLIAAAGTGSRLDELALGAQRRGLGLEALAPAERAGLVRADAAQLRFRHPLIRSAVYATATGAQRIAAHETIAGVLSDSGDQPRAAWHRAAAATGADESVAADLDRAATVLQARGDTGTAMRSWVRAAELSATGENRARRLAFAAEAARRAGLTATALRLADDAMHASTDPLVLARAALVEEILGLTTGVVTRDPLQVGSIARRAGTGPPLPPADAFLPVALLMNTAAHCAAYGVGLDVRRRIAADLRAVTGSREGRLTAAIRALLDPVQDGQAALEALRDMPPLRTALEAVSLGIGAEPAHDWALAVRYHRAGADRARADSAIGDLATAGVMLGRALAVQGRLDDAFAAAEEGRRLAADLGEHLLASLGDAVIAHLHAWRGDTGDSTAALARSRELGTPARVEITVWQRWTTGLTELAAGRHWNAYIELSAVCDRPEPGLLAIADLAEAATRAGYAASFAERLRAAEEYAATFDSPLIRMLLLRAGALLADDAEPLFTAALAVPGAAGYPLQLARSRLAYGEWLRRQRRIGEARAQFAAAARAFGEAGARPWLARAESEARASGAVTGTGEVRRGVLTAQELQIARLAAEGRTNKEIADHLFLSHRTVAAHLYRIYPKLGVTGRGALRDVIGGI
ncbi:LuxR family transcriptional regulator [Actinoplanes philippinensis]|uniref:Regulatory protein, luxR family n=1 Tax=Actinoplanes philippinensis TaxID=35752 RepID=A0A1I2GFV0_9ACTN|nr:helix-turn-helix transcriptional regulator [Actinoplanes philippinensis]GIE76883.1 LuxR family transcriptional regulator [Actinoplanes philippinensis]SFF15860.1 regulatory protein, luxR family [Actinoplanes philippinensis]